MSHAHRGPRLALVSYRICCRITQRDLGAAEVSEILEPQEAQRSSAALRQEQECTPGALGGFAVLLHKIEPDKCNPPICLSCFFFYLFGLLLLPKINTGAEEYVGSGPELIC